MVGKKNAGRKKATSTESDSNMSNGKKKPGAAGAIDSALEFASFFEKTLAEVTEERKSGVYQVLLMKILSSYQFFNHLKVLKNCNHFPIYGENGFILTTRKFMF